MPVTPPRTTRDDTPHPDQARTVPRRTRTQPPPTFDDNPSNLPAMMRTMHDDCDDFIPLTRNDSELSAVSAQSYTSSQSANAGSDFLEEAASAIATGTPPKKRRHTAGATAAPPKSSSKSTKSSRRG